MKEIEKEIVIAVTETGIVSAVVTESGIATANVAIIDLDLASINAERDPLVVEVDIGNVIADIAAVEVRRKNQNHAVESLRYIGTYRHQASKMYHLYNTKLCKVSKPCSLMSQTRLWCV